MRAQHQMVRSAPRGRLYIREKNRIKTMVQLGKDAHWEKFLPENRAESTSENARIAGHPIGSSNQVGYLQDNKPSLISKQTKQVQPFQEYNINSSSTLQKDQLPSVFYIDYN